MVIQLFGSWRVGGFIGFGDFFVRGLEGTMSSVNVFRFRIVKLLLAGTKSPHVLQVSCFFPKQCAFQE